MKQPIITAASTFLLLLSACSEAPKPAEKKAAPPPEPITGQSALYKMYQVARSWGPDVEVLKMTSLPLQVPGVKIGPGQAAAWEATFVSASRGHARSYTYSIVEGEGNLHKGVFAGLEEGWSGPRGVTKPFNIQAVKKDTDDAFKVAMEHKGAEYEKKNPGKPITYLLEKNDKFPDPSWRVVWGESVGTSNFSVYVDTATGDFQEVMR